MGKFDPVHQPPSLNTPWTGVTYRLFAYMHLCMKICAYVKDLRCVHWFNCVGWKLTDGYFTYCYWRFNYIGLLPTVNFIKFHKNNALFMRLDEWLAAVAAATDNWAKKECICLHYPAGRLFLDDSAHLCSILVGLRDLVNLHWTDADKSTSWLSGRCRRV